MSSFLFSARFKILFIEKLVKPVFVFPWSDDSVLAGLTLARSLTLRSWTGDRLWIGVDVKRSRDSVECVGDGSGLETTSISSSCSWIDIFVYLLSKHNLFFKFNQVFQLAICENITSNTNHKITSSIWKMVHFGKILDGKKINVLQPLEKCASIIGNVHVSNGFGWSLLKEYQPSLCLSIFILHHFHHVRLHPYEHKREWKER